ncbi:MAG: Gfo/Idh/MocA family protein [Pleomorphochaeta sp.]
MKIKVGIIGMGEHIGIAKQHIESYLALNNNVTIVALYDKEKNQCIKYKEKYNLDDATIYNSLDDLLDNVDAISICTPNNTHVPIALKASEKKVHVLCEKPFSTNRENTFELIESIEKSNIVNMIGLCYREQPFYRYLKDLIEKDTFGNIQYIKMSLGGGRFANTDVKREWRLNTETSGSGALSDFGSHMFDIIDYIFSSKIGKFKTIFAQSSCYISERKSETSANFEKVSNDDVCIFSCKTEKNVLANLTASRIGATHSLELYGDKGYALIDGDKMDTIDVILKDVNQGYGGLKKKTLNIPNEYLLINNNKASNAHSIGFYHEVKEFVENILNNSPKSSRDFKRGSYIQYLLDESYKSSKNNILVELNEE